MNNLIAKVEIEQFYIQDIKYPFYIRVEDKKYFNIAEITKDVKFLAPLDNLLWDRELVKELFNFEYTWEVYTPVVKRKYGYYVLPVLYGDEFIARFEPEIYRDESELRIKEWWWEDGVLLTNEISIALKKSF